MAANMILMVFLGNGDAIGKYFPPILAESLWQIDSLRFYYLVIIKRTVCVFVLFLFLFSHSGFTTQT